MNRSSKFNFFLPQNTDPIEVSDFNSNFETIDANLLTKAQSLTEAQKAAVRENVDLNVANNLTTTAAGYVLDARQGKALADMGKVISLGASDHLLTWAENSTNVPPFSQRIVYPGDTDGTDLPAGTHYKLYSIARITKASAAAISIELISYSGANEPVMYNRHTANGWSGWTERYNKNFVRIIKTYTDITIGGSGNGYVKIDDFSSVISGRSDVSLGWYLMSMGIRGWSQVNSPITLMKGTNGTDFYVYGASQTIPSLSVEYFFVNPYTFVT